MHLVKTNTNTLVDVLGNMQVFYRANWQRRHMLRLITTDETMNTENARAVLWAEPEWQFENEKLWNFPYNCLTVIRFLPIMGRHLLDWFHIALGFLLVLCRLHRGMCFKHLLIRQKYNLQRRKVWSHRAATLMVTLWTYLSEQGFNTISPLTNVSYNCNKVAQAKTGTDLLVNNIQRFQVLFILVAAAQMYLLSFDLRGRLGNHHGLFNFLLRCSHCLSIGLRLLRDKR